MHWSKVSECDFTLGAAEIEAVKPGDLVLVSYGEDRRYFVRHDDGSGDLIAYRLRNGHIAYCSWSRMTSAPWLPMMRTQRGSLKILASNMPRSGREIDGLKAVLGINVADSGNPAEPGCQAQKTDTV